MDTAGMEVLTILRTLPTYPVPFPAGKRKMVSRKNSGTVDSIVDFAEVRNRSLGFGTSPSESSAFDDYIYIHTDTYVYNYLYIAGAVKTLVSNR